MIRYLLEVFTNSTLVAEQKTNLWDFDMMAHITRSIDNIAHPAILFHTICVQKSTSIVLYVWVMSVCVFLQQYIKSIHFSPIQGHRRAFPPTSCHFICRSTSHLSVWKKPLQMEMWKRFGSSVSMPTLPLVVVTPQPVSCEEIWATGFRQT